MSEVSTLRSEIAKNESQKKYSERVLNLMNNPEFKEIIMGDYINYGLDQLLEARAHHTQQTPEAIAYNNRRLDGIALLKAWLSNHLVAGDTAEENLHDLKIELDMALEEEATDGEV